MSQRTEQPIPQGKYLPAVRHANLIFTSGMTPRKSGVLIYSGKIHVADPIESHREAIRLATLNALVAAQSCLKNDEKISVIAQLNVFLNAEDGFTLHTKLGDYASELLIEYLGAGAIGSRAAIGVASLPSDAPVEVTLIAIVG
ncbi:MAG: RidA family protein [Phototrophicaceae bacterium]